MATSRRRRAILWVLAALIVNVPFVLWLRSVPPRTSCIGLTGLAFDNCQISHSGRGLTIAVIVFAWILADAGLGALFYTSWTGEPIGSENFRRYGWMWGRFGLGTGAGALLYSAVSRWRRRK